MIPGGKSATAAAILEELKNWVAHQSPQFQEYFKERIVGIATDSAAAMVLFQRLMNEWITKSTPKDRPAKTLIQTYCLAHKINLASRSALIPLKSDQDHGIDNCLEYFASIEKFMQHTYTWVNLAQRRMGEYRDVVEEFRQPKIELKELHLERWISSEHTTVKYFLKGWKATRLTMLEINADTENYKKSVREDAQKFTDKLEDKQKLITIVFLQDYTAAFKQWSQILQRFVGLMSDQYDNYINLLNELEQIGTLNGGVLLGFLRSCTCSDTIEEPGEPCSGVEHYEQSVQITWNGQSFFTKDATAPLLSVLGPAVIQKSIERLNQYIPKDLIESFNVFSPKKFPAGKLVSNKAFGNDIDGYGAQVVRHLGNQFGVPGNTLVQHWNLLLQSILTSPSWDIERNRDTNQFWSGALRDNTLAWEDDIRYFIQCVKTVSVGTVPVEGSFSIFNTVKNQRRSKISDKLLEAVMNLQINGPSSIDHFDEFEYAMAWKNAGRRLPGDGDCEDKRDDDEIRDDPTGLNEIDDNFVLTDAEESIDLEADVDVDDNDDNVVDMDVDSDVDKDGDDLRRSSPWKYEKISRIRTLLM